MIYRKKRILQNKIEKSNECYEFISKPYETLLDQYAGSGNFVIACYNKKRNCIAIEKNNEMFEKMKELIAEQLNCPAEEIKMESSFKEDLGADSLDLFELVMSLEDTYGVEIPSEELEQLTTVESVVDYLKQKGVEA